MVPGTRRPVGKPRGRASLAGYRRYKAFMLKFVRLTAIVAIIVVPALGSADDAPDAGEHHGLRPEAIAACKDKSEGNACTFEGHHGTISGTCSKVNTGDLACVHPHPHHEGSGS
jgi:hypothetical protein